MKDEKNFITKEGLQELKIELKNLIDNERPKVIHDIKEARAQGDLSENAEFDAAREKQGQIEGRIGEIEGIILNSKIIKKTNSNIANISMGSLVKVEMNSNVQEYKIVGQLEADPFEGKISNVSPLGEALLGKQKGDKVSFIIDNGKRNKRVNATILEIK